MHMGPVASAMIELLSSNLFTTVPDVKELAVYFIEKTEILCSFTPEGYDGEDLSPILSMVEQLFDRMEREKLSRPGAISTFNLDNEIMVFVNAREHVLCLRVDNSASIDRIVPYAYIAADKIKAILEGEPVDLSIPFLFEEPTKTSTKGMEPTILKKLKQNVSYTFKLVTIGDANVGKTTLIYRFSKNKFKENFLPTLGVSITNNPLYLAQAKVNLSTWDLGGQIQYRRVRGSYYEGAHACLLLFDLTSRESFENLSIWNEEKEKHAGSIVTALIGNKSDLVDQRVVSKEEGIAFAKKNGFFYMETSAKTGVNVQQAFALVGFKIIQGLDI